MQSNLQGSGFGIVKARDVLHYDGTVIPKFASFFLLANTLLVRQ